MGLGKLMTCDTCEELKTASSVTVFYDPTGIDKRPYRICDNCNEEAYERYIEDFYGADRPITQKERREEDNKL
jgi:hypothetical protein